jgi:hypothetical protein
MEAITVEEVLEKINAKGKVQNAKGKVVNLKRQKQAE